MSRAAARATALAPGQHPRRARDPAPRHPGLPAAAGRLAAHGRCSPSSRRSAACSCRSPCSRPSTPGSSPTAARTCRASSALAGLAALGLLLGAVCSAYVNVRLFRSSESGLLALRIRAFRHVHDLSVLTQNTERRGSLVSRVTSDVDTISLFVQWGGIMLLVSVLQIAVATVLMVVYSWQLTLIVWAGFVPLFVLLQPLQKRVNAALHARCASASARCSAPISEAVVGAETIRAYGVGRAHAAPDRRGDRAPPARAMVRAQNLVAARVLQRRAGGEPGAARWSSSPARTWASPAEMSVGRLLAFLFLVQLFTGPVQMATEILNELQNAVAGWRRVLGVLETPVEVADPGADGRAQPARPGARRAARRRLRLPGRPAGAARRRRRDPRRRVGRGRRRDRLGQDDDRQAGRAVHGPDRAARCCSTASTCATSPSPTCAAGSCSSRRRASCSTARSRRTSPTACAHEDGDDRRAGRRRADPRGASRRSVWTAGWPSCADGLDTPVGQRGESLSAGERQLVALARAYLAEADLLLLDEATSAVDPATEVRIARALDSLTRGPQHADHRAPALDRRGGRPGRRGRRGPRGRGRAARRARRARRALRRDARRLGGADPLTGAVGRVRAGVACCVAGSGRAFQPHRTASSIPPSPRA